MITADGFVREIDEDNGKKNFKLGQVVELFENDTAKVKFDGEETPSEKQYAYIATYIPKISDRVLLAITGRTYIILGKVNFNVPPDTNIEIDRYVFDLKKVNILKGLELTGVFNVNSGMSVVGNVGINGNINAVGLSATGAITGASANISGAITGASANISGALDAGITKVSSLTATGNVKGNNLDATNTAYLRGDLRHSGSNIGLFNTTPTSRKTVNQYRSQPSGSEPNLVYVTNKLNDLIRALQDYGLISGS